MDAPQTILKFLYDNRSPFKLATIARQANYKEETAAKALTVLKKREYVQETKGEWSIAPQGIEQHELNPNFSSFYTRNGLTSERRENWAELLGPEVINSQLGRYILQEADKDSLSYMLPYLRFFVLCWLRAEGITVNFDTTLPTSDYNHDSPEGFAHDILNDINEKVR